MSDAENLPRSRRKRVVQSRLVRVWRDEYACGWGAVSQGREVLTFDHVLRERENNILQFAVSYLMRVRPSWLRRYGIPRNLKLRNLARLELTE